MDKGRNIPLQRSWAAVNINNAMGQENCLTPLVSTESAYRLPCGSISGTWGKSLRMLGFRKNILSSFELCYQPGHVSSSNTVF